MFSSLHRLIGNEFRNIKVRLIEDFLILVERASKARGEFKGEGGGRHQLQMRSADFSFGGGSLLRR